MIVKGRAIVLRATEYGEHSLIVKLFTEEFGLKSFMIHSARNRKYNNIGFLLNPLSLVEFSAYNKLHQLGKVKEINGSPLYHQIPFDIQKSSMIIFLGEIIYKSVKEEDAHSELFHFIDHALQWLDHVEVASVNFHLWMLLKMSKYLGFFPSGMYTSTTPIFDSDSGAFCSSIPGHKLFVKDAEAQAMYQLMQSDINQLAEIHLENTVRKNLLEFLTEYYQLHCPGNSIMKSHTVLSEVLHS